MSAPAPAPDSGLLTPVEAAARLRVNVNSVYRWLNSGALHGHRPVERAGGHWRVAGNCVTAFLGGEDEDDQQRRCPVCLALNVVPIQRGRRRR